MFYAVGMGLFNLGESGKPIAEGNFKLIRNAASRTSEYLYLNSHKLNACLLPIDPSPLFRHRFLFEVPPITQSP